MVGSHPRSDQRCLRLDHTAIPPNWVDLRRLQQRIGEVALVSGAAPLYGAGGQPTDTSGFVASKEHQCPAQAPL